MADGPTVTVAQLCQLFELDERRIQQLAAEGVVVRIATGRYDLLRSVRGYVKYLRDRSMRSDVASDSFTQQRARRAKAMADREERDNALAAGELISISDALATVGELISTTKQRLRGVGARVAPLLEGLDGVERKGAIDEAIDECLAELAKATVSFAAPAVADPTDAGGDAAGDALTELVGAAAETDGEPVG